MRLGTHNLWIGMDRENKLWFSNGGKSKEITDIKQKTLLTQIYRVYRKRVYDDSKKEAFLKSRLPLLDHLGLLGTESEKPSEAKIELNRSVVEDTIQKIINFFSEFSFEPNYRFINTFAYQCQYSKQSAIDYIGRYFELTDSQYTNSIIEKMKSAEFDSILNSMMTIKPNHKINSRFALYYGSAGTGKTTDAIKEADNNCITCHSAMLPSDLMEDFKFVDGKATFVPSALQKAMTDGKKIVLDEINLLPFESLRFLQTILDGKKEFIYKGKNVVIADGFKIIGTMNLVVNGSVYSLPEPLVDRADDLRKYVLTAKNLVGAII